MLFALGRSLGLVHAETSFDDTWQRFAPWMWRGLVVMAVTGAILILGEPLREAKALSFWLKMGMIVIALLGVLGLRRALAGNAAASFPGGTRLAAVAIVMVWVFIIFLGRFIAYDAEVWGSLSLGVYS